MQCVNRLMVIFFPFIFSVPTVNGNSIYKLKSKFLGTDYT